jgi:hypothetical protein
MNDPVLDAMRDLIQEDVNNRGLRADPEANLINAFPDDFAAACHCLAETENAAVAIVTGFYIPHAQPPAAETDGPLGALLLARALISLGINIRLVTDKYCVPALRAGQRAGTLSGIPPNVTTAPGLPGVEILALPSVEESSRMSTQEYGRAFFSKCGSLTHLIALERVGPSHTFASVQAQSASTRDAAETFRQTVPAAERDRCHTMRGADVTDCMSPAHLLFEQAARQHPPITTIGIGDGGNEIGMGKIPWAVIRRNIPDGGLVACRVPTDFLIVCGVSNWGAYALAAGVRHLRGARPDYSLFDPDRQRELLRIMVEQGPLVDGVTGKPTVTVDGLPFERYAQVLQQLCELCPQ